jgi:hypothetical protein
MMAIGTSIGGYRIIKAVGMDMVRLEKYQGFYGRPCWARAVCFVSSLTGIPVSTTHTKNHSHYGRRRGQEAFLRKLGRGQGDDPHLVFDLPGLRPDRLSDGKPVHLAVLTAEPFSGQRSYKYGG